MFISSFFVENRSKKFHNLKFWILWFSIGSVPILCGHIGTLRNSEHVLHLDTSTQHATYMVIQVSFEKKSYSLSQCRSEQDHGNLYLWYDEEIDGYNP